jgi:ABC-type multidrug transport system fused ATPase/permease subunit
MSILSLIKEKPQKKFERLFQITGVLSILVLIISILGICFTMFYHWYTPWHSEIDHLISWPEILGMAGLMWWGFINVIYEYVLSLFIRGSLPDNDLLLFLPTSIIAQIIFLLLLFFSIKSTITKKYQELTELTKRIIKIFILTFILNLIVSIIGVIEISYIHFLN